MNRFFFGLQGGQNTDDKHGLLYGNGLQAFRAAERLASELSHLRPVLRGNTCVLVARKGARGLLLRKHPKMRTLLISVAQPAG
jgi:hypothetical protein